MTDQTTTHYNWHEDDRDSFRSWLLVAIASSIDDYDEAARQSARFTMVDFAFTVNGVRVDTDKFIDRMERAITDSAQRRAVAMIREQPAVAEVVETLERVAAAAKEAIIRASTGKIAELLEEGY